MGHFDDLLYQVLFLDKNEIKLILLLKLFPDPDQVPEFDLLNTYHN